MGKLKHLGIIMDGNGRWAEKKNYSRTRGHVKGAKKAYEIIQFVDDLKTIDCLSLFAFSTENWKRPEVEVCSLMKIVSFSLNNNLNFFLERNIQVKIIGSREQLPENVNNAIKSIESKTTSCTGLNLNILINYSGKFDLVQAINKMIKSQRGPITQFHVDRYLMTSEMADPDVIIRTGNENRLSNFFLWQAAYSEIYFERKLWPDFNKLDLRFYIEKYFSTDRRFGKIEPKI